MFFAERCHVCHMPASLRRALFSPFASSAAPSPSAEFFIQRIFIISAFTLFSFARPAAAAPEFHLTLNTALACPISADKIFPASELEMSFHYAAIFKMISSSSRVLLPA